MTDPDNFCRYCNGGEPDCHWCEGTDQNFAVFGLSMDHEAERKARIRATQVADEQWRKDEDDRWNHPPYISQDEQAEIDEWSEILRNARPSQSTPQGEKYFQALNAHYEGGREGDAPKWEDYA